MKKNYFTYLFLFILFSSFSTSSQTYRLDDGMIGRMPISFKKDSFIKIQDSILILQIVPVATKKSVSEYKIVQDHTLVLEDRKIRTLRLLSTRNSNLMEPLLRVILFVIHFQQIHMI